MSQFMSYSRSYIRTQRAPGSRRDVGRITSYLGIMLEPRVPPKEGRSGEKSRERATRTQGRCRLRGPGEDLRGEPREWRQSLLLRSPTIGALLKVWRDPSSDPSYSRGRPDTLRPEVPKGHRDHRRAEGLLDERRRGTRTRRRPKTGPL